MQTASIAIESLCVPCQAHCRHCLLSAGGCVNGADPVRSMRFAASFLDWLRENRPELHGTFYIGCCNDFPDLRAYLRFLRKYSPSLDVLQFNGFAFRDDAELDTLMLLLREEGVRGVDLTFYGSGVTHDRFAGRKGDYSYNLRLIRKANKHGLAVHAGVVLVRETTESLSGLFHDLAVFDIEQYFTFLPHAKGRGLTLEPSRLRQEDFDRLCEPARAHFSRVPHKTEADWLREGHFPVPTRRSLTLALTQDNVASLEQTDPAETIAMLESLDDAFHAAMPSPAELALAVGQPENRQLFRWRDLLLAWQKRWQQLHPLTVHDMTDERSHFSVRF